MTKKETFIKAMNDFQRGKIYFEDLLIAFQDYDRFKDISHNKTILMLGGYEHALNAAKLILVAVKNGDLDVYEGDSGTDYLQILEDRINDLENLKDIEI